MAAEHSTRGEETDNGRSTTWSEVALANSDIMKGVMEEFMETKVHIPLVVSMLTNIIIKIFFGLKLLRDHQERFARLVADTSALVAIIWKLEVSGELPGSLVEYITRLEPTMTSVNKLVTTKGKRNWVKRKICIFHDLGKIKKYQKRINSVAVDLEQQGLGNVDITQIVQVVIREKKQGRRVIDDGHVEQEKDRAVAEASCSPKSATVKRKVQPTKGVERVEKEEVYGKQISEDEEITCSEEESLDEIVEEQQPRVNGKKSVVEQPRAKGSKRLQTNKYNSETDERLGGERGKKLEMRFTEEPEIEDDNVQDTPPRQSSKTTTVRPIPRAASAKRKGKASLKREERSRTTPTGRGEARYSVSRFSFKNDGGTMDNRNVGNIRVEHGL